MRTNPPPAECRAARARLLDLAVDPVERRSLPPSVEEHLRTCPGCRRYREGLRAARAGIPAWALYTPALRRRTIGALEERRDCPPWLALILLPASGAAVAAVLAPAWILAFFLRPLLGSEWLSAGLALLFSLSAGIASAGVGLAVLADRRRSPRAAAPARLLQEVLGE
jgi:hypothetical protein